MEDQRPSAEHPAPKNKLSEEEREIIVTMVNQPEFKSLLPSQIVPRLADKCVYIPSESTIYGILPGFLDRQKAFILLYYDLGH
ncbi:helix-turn-helix domain-containing protein [Paenisporosarcina sp. TG20]|uniref:helix-turn-helix domain-containing protein n=1 Tax=Paenisporosarcina sp. TG20 TaxID=1211706 RepID=UPI0003688B0F|nr:helix-turn-helix domain-containing protein [Paenisporosarcina sp. TG20]